MHGCMNGDVGQNLFQYWRNTLLVACLLLFKETVARNHCHTLPSVPIIKTRCQHLRGNRLTLKLSLLIGLVLVASASQATTYVAEKGVEPDLWASIWLIKRHINQDARFLFGNTGSLNFEAQDVIVLGSRDGLHRDAGKSLFATLLSNEGLNKPDLNRIAGFIHDIEVDTWALTQKPESVLVETVFRELQQTHPQRQVPFDCYLNFFDRLAAVSSSGDVLPEHRAQLVEDDTCSTGSVLNEESASSVAEMPIVDILRRMAAGENVVFLDTREEDEYEEEHIPTAIRYSFRELNDGLLDRLQQADLIVPYCVKDFRGYEVARMLQSRNIPHVAIMNPYGLKGWKKLGLPTTGSRATENSAAVNKLIQCGYEPYVCLAKK